MGYDHPPSYEQLPSNSPQVPAQTDANGVPVTVQQPTNGYPYPQPPYPNQQGFQQLGPNGYPLQQYPPPNGQQPYLAPGQVTVMQPQPNTIVVTTPVKPNNYMCLAWLTCLFCCWPIGLAAIICSCMSDSAYSDNRVDEAASRGRTSRALSIVACVFGAIAYVLVILRLTGVISTRIGGSRTSLSYD